MTETKLRPVVFKHIEAELYDYPSTKKSIKKLREQIMYGETSNDENIGVVRGSGVGRPTEQIATRLVTNKRLRNLEEVAEAIESVFNALPSDHQRVIELKYWDSRKLTLEGVAIDSGMHRNTASKYRKEFVYAVADKIGWS
jgi:RinA family phage transcriptional activator